MQRDPRAHKGDVQWGQEAEGSGIWDESGSSCWARTHHADTPCKAKHCSHQRLDFLSSKGSLMWMPFTCSPEGRAKGPPPCDVERGNLTVPAPALSVG